MYQVIYKDVVLFTFLTKQQAIDAITAYAQKHGETFDRKIKIFGRTHLIFYDVNDYYTYVIIKA